MSDTNRQTDVFSAHVIAASRRQLASVHSLWRRTALAEIAALSAIALGAAAIQEYLRGKPGPAGNLSRIGDGALSQHDRALRFHNHHAS